MSRHLRDRRYRRQSAARTAADRLTHYASQFPIVEVDATYYFRNAMRSVPAAVRELLPAALAEKSRVYLRDIPEKTEKLFGR